MVKEINASEFVYNCTQTQVWDLPEEWYNVVFSDQTILMHKNQIIGSWYYWEVYRHYPVMPIHSKGAITKFFKAKDHLEILGFIHWEIYNFNTLTLDISVWDISGTVVEASNRLFNMTCYCLVEWMPMGSMHDVYEIIKHPEVLEAKRICQEKVVESDYDENVTASAISEMESKLRVLLYENPELMPFNEIKRMATMGLVNENQLFQLIGWRGRSKDINDEVFHYPVEYGYGEGIQDLYALAIESRDAANAKVMQNTPLQISEYFNRKTQIAAAVIARCIGKVPFRPLEYGGCTGYETVPLLVTEDIASIFHGKFHMVEGKPILIWNDTDKYVGQIIHVRSTTGCGSPNVQEVCHICAGWSSLIMPPIKNFGYKVSSESGKIMTSKILSTKHLTRSAISSKFALDSIASKWFTVRPKVSDHLYLNADQAKYDLVFRISMEYVKRISQIQHISVNQLLPTNITDIPQFQISRVSKDGMVEGLADVIKLELGGSGVSLSLEMLNYIKQHGYSIGKGNGYIEFVVKKWDIKHPMFITPNKGENVMTGFNELKSFLEGKQDRANARISNYRSRAAAISEFIKIMQSGAGGTYNLTHLEIIIRSLMIVDSDDPKNFKLPLAGEPIKFGNLKQVIFNRSLGMMLPLERQFENLSNLSFLDNNPQTDHSMDALMGGSYD
jgi:hypothetical protein